MRQPRYMANVCFLVVVLSIASAHAATTIPAQTIATNTTWTKLASPYTVTGDVTVAAGVTLTLEPGVTVQFNQFAGLNVNGRIVADGTAVDPIAFTTSGTPSWDGIHVLGTSLTQNTGSIFDYVTIEYGGASYANLYLEYARVTVSNSTIRNSASDGINAWGIGSAADISATSFVGNTTEAAQFTDSSADMSFASITASGNGDDSIVLGAGTLTGAQVWENAGVAYTVKGSISIAASATLTIQPGVEVKFAQFAGLVVQGRILAVGTGAAPINFHGTTPGRGWWDGIRIVGTSGARISGSTFDHVSITDGGAYYGGIYAEYGDVSVANSTISTNTGSGIYAWTGVGIQVSNSTLSDNQNYAIEQFDPSHDAQLSGITAAANGKNAIGVHNGTLTGSHVWELAGLTYEMLGTVTVASGASLTIAPGLQLFFVQFGSLNVNGQLHAVGTSTQLISFARTAASPGAWDGIRFVGTSAVPITGSVLDWVTLSGGGNYYGGVYLERATVDISHATISGSAKDGLYSWTGGIPRLSDVVISGSAGYGIRLSTAEIDPPLTRVVLTGNAQNSLAMQSGTMHGPALWESLGFPYTILGDVTVGPDATLTIEPGVHVLAQTFGSINVQGKLIAAGTDLNPIVFDGIAGTPGSWDGIRVVGPPNGEPISGTIFERVSILNGGTYYANLYIEHAIVAVKKSIISGSSTDGVYVWTGGAGTVIEMTQIVSNTLYGVENGGSSGNLVVATNNWWGDPTGPATTGVCNPGGLGNGVKGAVAFKPFLTDPNAVPGIISPSDVRILEIQPHRWFAPANNLTRVYVDITLRDGLGNPLPGRVVNLGTSLGVAFAGGVTDVNGKSFAYLKSSLAGDAVIQAALAVDSVCESATSPLAKITFTPADQNALTPDAEAPYLNGGIKISPEPITRGVPTKISVTLTNSNAFPISVDGTFAFAQYGIGLVFGPLAEVTAEIIPANSTRTFTVDWNPIVSGHYCLAFDYAFTTAGKTAMPNGPGTGHSQRNLNVYPGSLGGGDEKGALDRADKAFKGVSKLTPKPLKIQKALIMRWWDWAKETAKDISKNLGGDPPRLDYDQIAVLEPKPVFDPVVASVDVSAARAAAINAYNDAMLEVVRTGRAAVVSMDRYGGAAQANDLLWTSQQAAALNHFKSLLGTALVDAADKLDAYLAVLTNEGVTTDQYTAQDFVDYQQRLQTTGFTAAEIADAKQLWFTDADIEAFKQEILAEDPVKVAGDGIVLLTAESTAMRQLGIAINTPQNFSFQISGSAGKTANAFVQPDRMARIYTNHTTFEVANPLATTADIELRVRRIGVPADWGVSLSPAALTLASGAQQTVDVAITPASPAVQGTQPRLAVEAYAGTQLLGGVVMDVIVPYGVPFRKGDATGDDALSVADVVYLVSYLYGGGRSPIGPADCNGDGMVTSEDLFWMINYMFAGGPAPLP